jgi:DNA-binding PadR family transcriptional regulator
MSTRLTILGLLRQRDLYGYELKQVIEEHMGDWTSIAFGSIYFALARLAKEGLLRRVCVGKKGNRPSRTVYGITAAGNKEFLRLLEDLWGSPERQFFPFDLALFFHSELPSNKTRRLLERRIARTGEALGHLRRHKAEGLSNPSIPRAARAIFDHTLAHLEAEQRWLKGLREEL